jgi:hypothetical protein
MMKKLKLLCAGAIVCTLTSMSGCCILDPFWGPGGGGHGDGGGPSRGGPGGPGGGPR